MHDEKNIQEKEIQDFSTQDSSLQDENIEKGVKAFTSKDVFEPEVTYEVSSESSGDASPTHKDDVAKEDPLLANITTSDGLEFASLEHSPTLFAHIADLHLAPRTRKFTKTDPKSGRGIRDLDMSVALHRAIDDILSQRPLPSAVVIAGDVFDTYQASRDAMIDASREFKRLSRAGIGICAIAGNHDSPTQRKKTPAFLVLKHEFENLVDDAKSFFAYDNIEHAHIGDIEFVLMPHNLLFSSNLSEKDFAPVFDDAKYRVLVVHGVAAGDPSLSMMDEQKEMPVARWIMDLEWDYIAFGHYHRPGWIPGYVGKAAYCGSLENTSLSEREICMRRGPVYVDISQDGEDKIHMNPIEIRRIVKLKDIDLMNNHLDTEELDREIENMILEADLDGAIAYHTIFNVSKSFAKEMPRRSFSSLKPEALLVETRIKTLPDTPKINYVSEDGEEGILEDEFYDEFRSLPKELSRTLDRLVLEGDIKEEQKENVQKILDELCG